MPEDTDVTSLIPHRPPFLFVDTIISIDSETIVTEFTFAEELDVYKGHYPGKPITPGVLLCEAVFQSGALLMGNIAGLKAETESMPVLTRITGARFKRAVLPGDTASITVRLKESIAGVSFFKGSLKVSGKLAVQVEFGCSLVAVQQ
jgi:3-hydroxyacyl-[acyl-carrier-protein] dehydratase